MCEECEESDALREVYLARRARMARTWTPRRSWNAGAVATEPVTIARQPGAGERPVAAE
jgi:hypothetical protein